jgi:hypothetical protein
MIHSKKYLVGGERFEEESKATVEKTDTTEDDESHLPVCVLKQPEDELAKSKKVNDPTNHSVNGANIKVPMPEPQMATPVTNGLFLSKYCVMQSRRGR